MKIHNGTGGSRETSTGKPERVGERGRESINFFAELKRNVYKVVRLGFIAICSVPNFVRSVPTRSSLIFCNEPESILLKCRIDKRIREPEEFLRRTQAAQRLQGRYHIRG
jgi:hypothetical protein